MPREWGCRKSVQTGCRTALLWCNSNQTQLNKLGVFRVPKPLCIKLQTRDNKYANRKQKHYPIYNKSNNKLFTYWRKNEIGIKQYSSSPSTKRMTTRLVISAVSIINSIISVAVDMGQHAKLTANNKFISCYTLKTIIKNK